MWFGGCVLAFIAGIVNTVGFLGSSHQAITHLTGTTTLSTFALMEGKPREFLHLLTLFLSFAGGAVLSGFIIQHSTLQLVRRYGVTLGLESIFLVIATILLSHGILSGEYLAAAACGIQNAMASSYSGAVIRTTHVSGMVTDIGIIIGHWLRGLEYDSKKLRLYALLISRLFLGGMTGAFAFSFVGYFALLLPALLTGFAGTAYAVATRGPR